MSGFVGNTPFTTNPSRSPRVSPGGNSESAGDYSKVGKAILKALDSMSFDVNIFAYWIVGNARNALRKRLMQLVLAIIKSLAIRYDSGEMDDETTNGKRLYDTVMLYDMEN